MQVYSPDLNKRCQAYLKRTNKSYWVDEIYTKVEGQDKYLYRAVGSTGQTIDFLPSAKRNTEAAKRFFEKVFNSSSNPIQRVIIETMSMIRKGRIRWVAKGDVVAEARFIAMLFAIAA